MDLAWSTRRVTFGSHPRSQGRPWPGRLLRSTIAGHVVRAPFALVLVSALLATTIWTRSHPDASANIFAWVSTNAHNLSIAPARSLVLSALFLPDEKWVLNATLLLAVIVPLERRVGTRWALAVFASAHVLATLLTEGWVSVAVRLDWLPRSAAYIDDVGVSYGLYGVAAASCYFLPARFRRLGVSGLVGYLALQFAIEPDMTNTGHLLALASGLAWWRGLERLSRRRGRA